MNISDAFRVGLVIGHGPSTRGLISRVIMFALGILFAALAVAPGTRLRGAFMHGKGPSLPIGSAGRLILGLVALVMFLLALGIIR